MPWFKQSGDGRCVLHAHIDQDDENCISAVVSLAVGGGHLTTSNSRSTRCGYDDAAASPHSVDHPLRNRHAKIQGTKKGSMHGTSRVLLDAHTINALVTPRMGRGVCRTPHRSTNTNNLCHFHSRLLLEWTQRILLVTRNFTRACLSATTPRDLNRACRLHCR